MAFGSIGGVYGLSGSGMDIDSIVKKLMMTQQAKSDALFQKKTIAQWQKTAYNTVYDDISKFRDTLFNYKMHGTLNPNKVSSTNTSVVTATANSDAADVNHSVVVAQLASGVNLTSASSITTGASKDTVANQFYGGTAPTGPYTFTISDGTTTSEPITIDPNGSINDLVSQINKSGLNIKASYDSTLDRFFMSTTITGSSAGISIVKTEGDPSWGAEDFFVGNLQLPSGVVGATGIKGQDAAFQLDGVGLTQASNEFSISSVTYNLTGVSSGTLSYDNDTQLFSGSGLATSVSVSKDTDAAVDSIQALVDSYNKIMADLNGKMKETRYKGFPPLTDAQRGELKESEIIAWEAKAKSGMLHNDTTLTNLVNSMRNILSSPVTGITGSYNSASSIGITTGVNYLEGGKLYLDTNKLRTALTANPDVLNELFNAEGTEGIVERLRGEIKTTMDRMKVIASTTGSIDTSSSYAKKISDYDKQISKAALRYDNMQTAYYKQFNAMEVALQQLSTQSSWLSSQFGG